MDQRSTSPVTRRSNPLLVGGALVIALAVIAIVAGGLKGRARQEPTATTPAPAATREAEKDVRFTQLQRTTEPLPGLDGVRASLGDVTGGKVKLSMSLADGKSLVEERSLARGDLVKFEHEKRAYQLTIAELRNALVGDDEVVMVLARAREPQTKPALTEEEKIERLIASVNDLKGAVFIRNGGEHPAADAVEHMRRKWQNGKDRIKTAKQFIEHAASRSSLSGEVYRIRMADGTEMTSEAFLKKKLAELEAAPPTTRPAKAG